MTFVMNLQFVDILATKLENCVYLVLEAALLSLSSSDDSSASEPEHQLSSELLCEAVCCSVLERG